MALFDFVTDLFFDDPEVPEPNWDQLKELMLLGIDKNRYDQSNLFTSFNWDGDKESLTQSVNPNIQGGFNNFLSRVNDGESQGYDRQGATRGFLNAYEQQRNMDMRPYSERADPPNRRQLTPGYAQQILAAMQGRPQ